MSKATLPIRKIIKLVFITSLLIGVLAIIPYVFSTKIVFFNSTSQGILFLLLSIILIWAVNLLLLIALKKNRISINKEILRYIFSYIICIAIVLVIRMFLVSIPNQENSENKRLFIKSPSKELPMEIPVENNPYKGIFYIGFVWGTALNTMVLLMLDLALLRDKKQRIELENAKLRINNTEATNQQLKQQIHPHFLFNSLSTLQSLIKKDQDKAEVYLNRLSDFLRASLHSGSENTTPLKKELELCNDFLEMQKMRFGDAFTYTVDIPEKIQYTEQIPIFSLLSLLENAIKHNKFTKEKPLEIQVKYEKGIITTKNNIQSKESYSGAESGLGLKNLQKRYAILSGDEVIIENDGKTFSVSIKTLKK